MKQIAAAVVAVLGALVVGTAEANVPEWEVPAPVQTDCMSSECYAPLTSRLVCGGTDNCAAPRASQLEEPPAAPFQIACSGEECTSVPVLTSVDA